jgi:hypothetical protein
MNPDDECQKSPVGDGGPETGSATTSSIVQVQFVDTPTLGRRNQRSHSLIIPSEREELFSFST